MPIRWSELASQAPTNTADTLKEAKKLMFDLAIQNAKQAQEYLANLQKTPTSFRPGAKGLEGMADATLRYSVTRENAAQAAKDIAQIVKNYGNNPDAIKGALNVGYETIAPPERIARAIQNARSMGIPAEKIGEYVRQMGLATSKMSNDVVGIEPNLYENVTMMIKRLDDLKETAKSGGRIARTMARGELPQMQKIVQQYIGAEAAENSQGIRQAQAALQSLTPLRNLARGAFETGREAINTGIAGLGAGATALGETLAPVGRAIGQAVKTPLMMTEGQMELIKQDMLRRAMRQQLTGGGSA